MSHTRLTSLRSLRTSSQRRDAERRTRRSVRLFERLEDRNLLSGSSLPFHNGYWPTDVDNNLKVTPQDVLQVVNSLNNGGSRQLSSSPVSTVAASGEAGGATSAAIPSGSYVDVNGDGLLTPTDALGVINAVNGGEGETNDQTDMVRYKLTVTDTSNVALPLDINGNPVIAQGQTFRLRGSVQDVRLDLGGTSTGVFAAYMNVNTKTDVSSLITLRYGETQQLLFVPTTHADTSTPPVQVNDTITGNFTLTYNGQTTASIPAQDTKINGVTVKRAQLIQNALAALSNIGTGNVQVTASLTNSNAFNIRFINNLGERDIDGITGNFSSLLHLASTPVIQDNFYPADVSSQGTFASSFAHVSPYINGPSPSADSAIPAAGSKILAEVGSFLNGFSIDPADSSYEFFTVDIKANSAGEVDFFETVPSTLTGHETLVFPDAGGGTKFTVLPSQIGFIQDANKPLKLMILPPVSAGTSQLPVAEDSGVSVSLNLLANSQVNASAGGVAPAVLASVSALSDPTAGQLQRSGSNVTFTPASNYNGTVTFTYVVNDSAASPNTHTSTGTATITVSAVNDPPVNQVPGPITMDEDTILSFEGSGSISVSDVDAPAGQTAIEQVTLTATHGTLTLGQPTGNGLTYVTGDGTNDDTMKFTGTLQQMNAAMAGMVFTPTANYNGSASVVVATSDLGNIGTGNILTANSTIPITVRPTNDPPVNVVPPSPQTMQATGTLVLSGSAGNTAISVSDPLDTPYASGQDDTVRVTLSVESGTLTLQIPVPGALTVLNNGSSTVTVTGLTQAIDAALSAGLSYAGSPASNHTLTVTTDDLGNVDYRGASQAIPVASTVTIVPPKKPLAVDDQFTMNEGDAPATINVLVNDLNGVPAIGGQDLTIDAVSQGSQGGTVVINGGSITYTVPNANFAGQDTFTYEIIDTVNVPNNGASTGTVTVTVNAVNDSPAIVVVQPQAPILEDHTATLPAGAITITDVDAGTGIMAGTITVANGTLNLAATTGLSLTGNDSSSLTLTGTLDALNAATVDAVFTPAKDFVGQATIVISVSDQGNTGSGGAKTDMQTMTISVSAVNDAPSLTASDVAVDEGSGPYSQPWATFSPGPANEIQTVDHYTVAVSNNAALFSTAPAVDTDGTLTFTPRGGRLRHGDHHGHGPG